MRNARSHRRLRKATAAAAIELLLTASLAVNAFAQSDVLVIADDDRIGSDYRDASFGIADGGDFLLLRGANLNKLPVEHDRAFVGDNAMTLQWRHQAGGRWDMFVAAPGWVGMNVSDFDSLVFFVNGPDSIDGTELPMIGLEDTQNVKSALADMGARLPALDDDTLSWQRVALPLTDFEPYGGFDPTSLKTVRFSNSSVNDTVRTMWVDLIAMIRGPAAAPAQVSGLNARVGDRSVILHWDAADNATIYHVARGASPLGPFTSLGSQTTTSLVDHDVVNDVHYYYTVSGSNLHGTTGPSSDLLPAAPSNLDDEAFLELVAHTAFDYFWYEANPENGLVKDRSTATSRSSIAAVGFGLTAIPIGIERGWISPEEGRTRVLNTLEFFWNSEQSTSPSATGYKGFYYHFLEMDTGRRAGTTELSTIDTALLLGGVIFAGEYFDGQSPEDERIRSLADSIYLRVDWNWASPRAPRVSHGWRPESGYIPIDWGGYNEAMIVYLLALGSPTHPVPASAWSSWTSTYKWQTHFGHTFVVFPPLFGHQYTHAWFDFREIQDPYMRTRGIDYFENSRRATLANRAYCISNPGGWAGYGPDVWGLTASDGPDGYRARGAPPAQNDEGTIAPTAAGGSMPFTPEESLAALREMYDRHRERLWASYGFTDAFNVSRDWFDTNHLGIDQGPILLMIENHRTGLVWDVFMRNEHIQTGLARAGFLPTSTGLPDEIPDKVEFRLEPSHPNPFSTTTRVSFTLPTSGHVRLDVYDIIGRHMATLLDHLRPAGSHDVEIDGSGWTNGVYLISLRFDDQVATRPVTLIK